jgi:hypothetical protein
MSALASSGASPTKRRRTRAEITAIRDAMSEILSEEHPATVRQLFYQLVSRGLIRKTEGEYNSTVDRLLVKMRREGSIPYSWIADSTRWVRRPKSFSGPEEWVRWSRAVYRRDPWLLQDVNIEVWIEKDALAGVLYDVTAPFDVPLYVARGYSSLSFLSATGEAIQAEGKPTVIYYLGDHDPSGNDIARKVEAELRGFAPDVEIEFNRLAVTPAQIKKWSLPTRPTKTSDSRAAYHKGDSTDVDAIPARRLRALVEDAISGHIDRRAWEQIKTVEAEEQDAIARLDIRRLMKRKR